MLSKKSENEKATHKAKRGKKKFRSFAKKPTKDSETLETFKSCKTVVSVPKKADQASANWKNILNVSKFLFMKNSVFLCSNLNKKKLIRSKFLFILLLFLFNTGEAA
jgi:hypothetical protein